MMEGRFFKKTAAFIMALCILSGGLPQATGRVSLLKPNLTADAADSTVSFDEKTATLILSGNVNKDDVIAYAEQKKVKSVVCEKGTVFPEDCSEMFQFFYASKFDLSNADTSNVTNMNYMFNTCKNVIEIDLTGWDTSKVTSMYEMFNYCSDLRTIYVNKKWNMEAVTNYAEMFDFCNSLVGGSGTVYAEANDDKEYAHIDGGEENPGYLSVYPSKVTFDEKTGVLTLSGNIIAADVSAYKNNEKVKHIVADEEAVLPKDCDYLFDAYNPDDKSKPYWSGVESIDLSKANTSDVTSMICMFRELINLKSVDLSSFDTSKVIYMIEMFGGCENLTSLDLSSFDTSKVESMRKMFYEAQRLKAIKVSEKWSTEAVTSSDYMFTRCYSLTGKNGTAFDWDHIDQEYARIDTEETPGYFTDETVEIVNPYTFNEETGTLTLNGEIKISYLSDYMDNPNVKHIVAAEGSILPENCDSLFASYSGHWKNVTSIDLSKADSSNVTNMSNMFNASNVLSIDISGFDTSKVTDMIRMFCFCDKLQQIKAGEKWTTENVTDSQSMFYNCYALVGKNGTTFDNNHTDAEYARLDTAETPGYFTDDIAVVLPTIEFDKETGVLTLNGKLPDTIRDDLMPYAKNEAVTSIVCSEGTVFPEDCTYLFIGNNNRYWKNVFSIDLSKADTSKVKNMYCMFAMLENVTSINVSGWNTENVTDMMGAFYGCTNLVSLDLRSFDTSKVEDMYGMFMDCKGLTQIAVSDKWNIDSVEDTKDMFSNCINLQGKNGTSYNSSIKNGTYAHIDTAENPGYLTDEIKNVSPIIVFDKATGTLTLNGNVPYSTIEAYKETPGVQKIVAAEGTVLPENCSFLFDSYNPYNSNSPYWADLEAIDLSKADTSKVKDMSCMFRDLTKLNTLDISGFDTSNVTDMSSMFMGCESLYSIDLRSFDTSKVEDMSKMFKSCTNLAQIVVSDKWGTDAVTNSEDMFYKCTSIVGKNGTKYTYNNITHEFACIDTEETPGYFTDKKPPFQSAVLLPNGTLMLYGDIKESEVSKTDNLKAQKVIAAKGSVLPEDCDGLFQEFQATSIDLSNADSSKVVSAANMFNQCANLEDLRLGNFDSSRVKSFWAWFNGCKSLAYLDLSMLDTRNATNMKFMFSGCSSLKAVVVGDKWDTSKVTISDRMFEGCTKLTGGQGTAFDAEKTDIAMAHVDTEEAPGYLTEPCTKYDKETGKLTLYGNVSNNAIFTFGYEQEVSTGNYGFINVKNITCEKGTVLPKDCSQLFAAYWNTETIDLSNADTSKVENMSHMFYNCVSLTSVDLTSFDTSKVKYMTYMFADCPELTSLDLNSFDTSSVTSTYGMFSGCTKLSSIIVSNRWNMDNVTNHEYMFNGCTALVGGNGTKYALDKIDGEYARIDSADAPGYFTAGSIVTFDEETGTLTLAGNVKKSDVQAYKKNEAVKKVVCAEGTVLPEDCSWLFENFKAETIDLSNADTSNVTDMSCMFDWCTNLVSINLDNIDTSKVTNMNSMFHFCYNIKTIDVSSFDTRNVTDMSLMFEYCYNLESIDLNKFDTIKVKSMMGMFSHCGNLKSLELSSFDTSNVTDMSYMYFLCETLESLDLSSFDTKNVTNMGSMFGGCLIIESLDLSGFDTSNVTNMSMMFATCSEISKITVSDKWTTEKVEPTSETFFSCIKLVGGYGTEYTNELDNMKYARVDKPGAPGYLTDYEVDKVVTLIDELGTYLLTDEKEQKYNEAVEKYLALSKEKQTLVRNFSDLEKADVDRQIMISIKDYTNAIYGYIKDTEEPDMEKLKNTIDLTNELLANITEEQAASIPYYAQFKVSEKYYNALETANKYAEEAAAQKAAAEKATADKEAAEKALAEANEKLEAAQADLKKAKEDLAATQAELETAQTDLAAAQKALDTANADLKAANASVADLEKQLAAAEEKIAALEEGAEADELLQKEIADLKEQLTAAKTAQTAAEKAQAAAESDAKTAQANAEKAAAAQKKAEEAQAAAEAEAKTAQENAEKAAAAQKKAEEAQAAAEKEAAAQKAAAEKATADKEAAEKALAEANEKLATTQAELDTAQTDLAAAQKSLDKANADLKAANASVADLTEQLTAAEEKIAALEDGAEADELLQNEIADLKKKLEAAKTAKTAAEKAQAAAESDAKTAQANAEKAAAAQKKAEEAQATAEAAKAKAEKELEELKASLVKTTIKIGDVDSDGTVDTKDAMLFTRYYNGDESVTIDLRAADLDRDGEVTLRDVMILTRYVNGWEGYDTYIVGAEI